ncbi:hypothetical protein [Xanthomonas albilineans]|uniref:Relaxation protein n=3 Tax=Xanthomonas albilineans TaxID=29447 RepID=D2UDY8_XANAP|nr:hypothetical protein [Xanthomonas albilineans]QHQ28524.1 hypothetical protein XaFJ1_GM001785 [Xanthomonas albilineans]CBA16291.1 hypothetical protein XALC_1797 [Xanthomonas albilineans GPE PC73]
MHDDEQTVLSVQMAAMIERFEARCDMIEHRLGALAEQVPSQVQEQMARWLQSASGQLESVTRAGLEPPLAEARDRVQGITTAADQTVRALQLTRRDMTSIVRWVWIGGGVSLLCALVALVGTYKMLYGDYATRYDTLRAQLNYMEAINRSDIVPCGDGRLCVNIDEKAPKVGDKKQYRLVKPRP